MKYFVRATTDWSGTECYELIEAKDIRDAEMQALDIARENYEGYSNIWEEEQKECEKDGAEWIDSEHYDYDIEEYNPKKHDGYLTV